MQTPAPALSVVDADLRRGTAFLEESPGNSSAMRLMCMMALVTAIILAVFHVVTTPSYKSTDEKGRTTLVYPPRDPQAINVIYAFLVAAFAPKAIQKFAEQKLPVYNPSLPIAQATTMVLPANPAAVMPTPAVVLPATPPAVAADVPGSNSANRLQLLKNRGGL